MTTDAMNGNKGRKAALVVVALGLAAIFVGSLIYRLQNPGMQKQVQTHSHGAQEGMAGQGMDMDAVRQMMEALQERVGENPADLEALFQLAEIQLMRQDEEAALGWLAQVREQAGEDIPALHRLSSMYFQMEKNEDAAEALRRIIEVDPADGYARYNLAVLLKYRVGDAEGAAEAFSSVLDLEGFDDLKEQARAELENTEPGAAESGNP